jgi:tocopherol O-methyltransferase
MSHNYTKFDTEGIVKYYHRTEWVYRDFWKLDIGMGLHFGLWDETVKSVPEAIINQNKIMAKMAGIQSHHKVLDAGCGVGGSSIYLAKNIGCNATGITITPKQVIRAGEYAIKEGVSDKVQFKEMDYTTTNFADNSFDFVWAIESVCHTNNKKAFFKEAFRVLKPGGKIVMADCFQTKETLTDKEFKQLYTNGVNGWAVSEMCNEKTFKTYCDEIGFKDFDCINVSDKAEPSIKNLIKQINRWLIPGWLYYKVGGISDTEFMNAYGTYNTCKTLRTLWDYKVLMVTKP